MVVEISESSSEGNEGGEHAESVFGLRLEQICAEASS